MRKGRILKGLKKAASVISQAKSIAIACHINPDGDTIGSLLSLGQGLASIGKKTFLVSQDGVPKRYRFLSGAGRVVRKLDRKVDLAISVDCGTKVMLGTAYRVFQNAGSVIEIDHHEFRKPFGDISLVDPNAAATGEMVHELLKELKVEITREIAEGILTSLIVETNSFRLPNVNPAVFKLSSELMKKGVDFHVLTEKVFWTKTRESVLLSGICLSRCRFEKKDKLVWSIVRKKDFDRIKGKDEDVDAVADEMRAIRDVKIAILFREKDNGKLRVSLRSKENVNVASVAEHYGGGGHSDVAGCVIPNTKKDVQGFLADAASLL